MPMERPGGQVLGNPRKLSVRQKRPSLLSKPLLVYAGIRAFGSGQEKSGGGGTPL